MLLKRKSLYAYANIEYTCDIHIYMYIYIHIYNMTVYHHITQSDILLRIDAENAHVHISAYRLHYITICGSVLYNICTYLPFVF